MRHTLNKLTAILVLIGLSFTLQAQTYKSDRNLSVNISEDYDTFAWSTHAANEQDVYFLSDALIKSELREAIKYELESRNYQHTESNPDLIVNFRVFEEPLTFKGYEKTYADRNYWGPNEIRKNMVGLIPEPELREYEDQEKYFMDAGSLLVQLVDAESGEIVWQGIATEMLKENKKDEIKQTVQTLFGEEFNFSS